MDNLKDDFTCKKIKILFLIDELNSGGTERQLILLCENLSRKHFCPTIGVLRATDFSRKLKLDTPIVNFNWQGLPFIKNVQLVLRIRRYISQENFDFIQTQFQEAEIYGSVASFLSPKKHTILSTRRNLYHWIDDEQMKFRLTKLVSKNVNHIISNSYAAREKCMRMENIEGDKVSVVPNAINISSFSKIDILSARTKLNIDPFKKVVGVVGNLRPVKGVDYFIKAAGILSNEYPDMLFVVAGQGEHKGYLEYLAEKSGVGSKTLFLENAHIPTVVASFDVAVQPSLSESLSNVLLEYMASSKPIVATDVGDARLLIETGSDGILIEAGIPDRIFDAVSYMIKNRELADMMGKSACARVVGHFSISNIVEKYEKLYMSLL
ncbi:MAG: glycosyltransferase family 4 protein [Thermodesulfobacteriota bacterium]